MWKLLAVLALLAVSCQARHLRKHRRREITECRVADIQSVDVSLNDLSGVWFKVLHKYGRSTGKTSFTLKNEVQGNKLVMTEYYTKDGECEGPISGEWTKPSAGKIHFKITKEGRTHEFDTTIVYHYKHPYLVDEQLLAIYGCKKVEDDGTCSDRNKVGAIMSKNRRPLTHSLYHAAKALERACVNPVNLVRLNTQTSCGDELLEDEDKYEEGDSDESEESEETTDETDPCNVDNIEGIEINLDEIPQTKYYMIAAHDGHATKSGITMMSIEYKGEKQGNKLKTHARLVKHGVCLKNDILEWVDPNDSTVWKVKFNVRLPSGPTAMEVSFKLIYHRGGVSIGYWCTERDPAQPGKCKKPRVSIWSESPHIRLGQLALAFLKLRSICVDPRHMIFMNTHARCENPFDVSTHEHTPAEIAAADRCKVSTIAGMEHFNFASLEGVWYAVGGIGTEAVHPHVRSGVIKRTRTDDPKVLNSHAYISLVDGSCISVTGTLKLINAEQALVEYDAKATINGQEKTIKHQAKVLHHGSQLTLFYVCQEEKPDGTCKNPIFVLDSRTRELRHRDILNMKSHINTTCINPDSIKWFFMHSQCGKEFDPPFSQRHGYLAMSHSDVMDIITKFSAPTCKVSDIKGQNVCLKGIAEAGPWYSVAYYDQQWGDFKFYGALNKMKYTGNGTSTAVEQAVFDAGEGKTCHEAKSSVYKENDTDKNDVIYLAKFSFFGTEYAFNFRWVWTNYRLGVGYWCRSVSPDGTCPRSAVSVYIMSNHESIDHAEWLLLEQIVRWLCVDPALFNHMSAHEYCLIEYRQRGTSMYPPRKDCNWDDFKGLPFTTDEAEGTFHTMAIASRTSVLQGLLSRSHKIEKIDADSFKVTAKYTDTKTEGCQTDEMVFTRGEAESNEWKSTIEYNGEQTPVSLWLGHMSGPYGVFIGCVGDECGAETGFVFIDSDYRANDKMAIQQTFEYLQDNCINPDWLNYLDTHNACGNSMDTRTCRVADFQGLQEFNDEGFDGVWYLTAHNSGRYTSMKCKAESGDATDDEVSATCYAKMGEVCHGPSEGKFTRSAAKPGRITYTYSAQGKSHTMEYYLMYQDNNHLLMVGCAYLSGDGSCFAERTSLMIWSKRSSITKDSLPAGLLEKMENVCVHTSRLVYMSETDCGKELS